MESIVGVFRGKMQELIEPILKLDEASLSLNGISICMDLAVKVTAICMIIICTFWERLAMVAAARAL